MDITNQPEAASTSPMSAVVTMFYEPTQTFAQLESRPRGWFPALILVLATLATMIWYFAVVDFPWLIDQMSAAMKTAEEREMFTKTMSKTMLQSSSLISAVVMLPLMFAITGAYLMIVSKTLSHGISFGKAFALSAWASIPSLLMLPLAAIQIMLNPAGQLDFSALNPLSLNQLVFHYDMANPLASLMDMASLTTIWSMALLIIGFEVWAKVKRATAVKVVVLPYLIIFGAWFGIVKAMAA